MNVTAVIINGIAVAGLLVAFIKDKDKAVQSLKMAGKTFNLKAGEIIIMPANEPHAVKAVKKFKMILIMIKS